MDERVDERTKVSMGLVRYLNPVRPPMIWTLATAAAFVATWTSGDVADALDHLRNSSCPEVGLACIAYQVRMRRMKATGWSRAGASAAAEEAHQHNRVMDASPRIQSAQHRASDIVERQPKQVYRDPGMGGEERD